MNWRLSRRRIASTNSTPIFKGDAVVPVTGTATGYIAQATATQSATIPLAGVFWGCEYLSVSQKRTVWSPYWPGSDANGDVLAYVIDDPQARFVVQTSGTDFQISGTPTNFGSSPVGQLARLNTTGQAGSTVTGNSGMYLDDAGTTNWYPFQIVQMVIDPPGTNGADAASQYNYVIVGFNNEWLRGNTAVTGIS
jgi:hypothetical protein